MRIAKIGSQREVLPVAGLDRKAKKPAVSQCASNFVKHPRQVSDVSKNIGGDRKIELFGLHLQVLDQFAADQIVVDLTLPRDLEHIRRNIDSTQRAGKRTKAGSE